jgi:DNA-binding transcriptional LysR family regulator
VSDNLHDMLRERVDIAVRYGVLRDSALVARRLHVGPRTLAASPAYIARCGAPQHPRDLAQHNCIALYLSGRPQLQWTFTRDGQSLTVKAQGNRRADDGALVRQWAVDGFGIVYKSRLDIQADLDAGRLVELMPDWRCDELPLHAIVPAREHMPLRVRRLLDELVVRFAAFGGDTATVPS